MRGPQSSHEPDVPERPARGYGGVVAAAASGSGAPSVLRPVGDAGHLRAYPGGPELIPGQKVVDVMDETTRNRLDALLRGLAAAALLLCAGRIVVSRLQAVEALTTAEPAVGANMFDFVAHLEVLTLMSFGSACAGAVAGLLAILPTRKARGAVPLCLFSLLAFLAFGFTIAGLVGSSIAVSTVGGSQWTCRDAGSRPLLSACVGNPLEGGQNVTTCATAHSVQELAADSCLCERVELWPSQEDFMDTDRYYTQDVGASKCPPGSTVFTGLTMCSAYSCTSAGEGQTCGCDDERTDGRQTRCYLVEALHLNQQCGATAEDTLAGPHTLSVVQVALLVLSLYPLGYLMSAGTGGFVVFSGAIGTPYVCLVFPMILAHIPSLLIQAICSPLGYVVAWVVTLPFSASRAAVSELGICGFCMLQMTGHLALVSQTAADARLKAEQAQAATNRGTGGMGDAESGTAGVSTTATAVKPY